jgi:hypothetical protein
MAGALKLNLFNPTQLASLPQHPQILPPPSGARAVTQAQSVL